MLSHQQPVPRLVDDTYRTMIALAMLMVASLLTGFGYGLAARRYNLPLGDLSGFVLYAVAYLRLGADHGGLRFPGDAPAVWSDYVYLAVQLNATFSSSDVDVT